MPNFAYTQDSAAYTYQGTGTVMGSGSDVAYGLPGTGAIHPQAHLSVIGWVLFAVLGLVLLDRGGFKFMFVGGRGG